MTEFLMARPNLIVRDVTASIAFYRDVLGFSVTATLGDPPYFGLLHNGGAEIAVVRAPDPQVSGCYIYVRGVNELHDRLMDTGQSVTPLTPTLGAPRLRDA